MSKPFGTYFDGERVMPINDGMKRYDPSLVPNTKVEVKQATQPPKPTPSHVEKKVEVKKEVSDEKKNS